MTTLTEKLKELKELTDTTKDRWHAQRFYFPRLIKALEEAVFQRDCCVKELCGDLVCAKTGELKSDYDIAGLNEQLTEILEGKC